MITICYNAQGRARIPRDNRWEFNHGYLGHAFISERFDTYEITAGSVRIHRWEDNNIYDLDVNDKVTMDAFYEEFKPELRKDEFELIINL